MKFEATTTGKDVFALCHALQLYAEEYWLTDRVTAENAPGIILDAFKRKVAGQLELLDVKAAN